MTLERFRPYLDSVLDPVVGGCVRLGLTPHIVSVLGFVVALGAAGIFVAAGDNAILYVLGAVLVAISGILDVVDGALARKMAIASDAGDILDHTLDRYADIVLIGGLAVGIDQVLLGFLAVTGVLMTSYLGTQAQAVGYGRLYAGLLGRSDRLVLIGVAAVAMAVEPGVLYTFTIVGWLLVVFAIVGHVTAVQRFTIVWRSLR